MRLPVVWCALGYRSMRYREIPLPWDTATPCTCLFAIWNGITGKTLELTRNSLPHWTIPTRGSVRWQK
jgi:N6-adenosine-specific RNA methylase IME4